MFVIVGFLKTGGVDIKEKFLTLDKDICSVRGRGVADRYKRSHERLFFKILSFCLTPKRCSSSTIKRPQEERAALEFKTRCVEIKILPTEKEDKKAENRSGGNDNNIFFI